MGELSVTSVAIEEVLNRLRSREWQVPQFQRDFVWNVGDVIDLVRSIFHARPIGMITLWEQTDDSELQVEPVSLLKSRGSSSNNRVYFQNSETDPRRVYALLDGLQRCTAMAMAFGGFRSEDSRLRFAGRYFLDAKQEDPLEQIVYYKENEVRQRDLDKDAVCFSKGLFPLSTNKTGEPMMSQWLRYVQAIRDAQNYPDSKLPETRELERRDDLLKKVFEGLSRTKLAVYVVPADYSLAQICEIFEKLNTTGTKVSTVDLIHSWLYADTVNDATGSVQLRDWIDEFGQRQGAVGWANSQDRPELIVQMVTASYVALENKPDPRQVGKGAKGTISSVKAADLLATPTPHWKTIMSIPEQLAEYLRDFQLVTAGGLFPYKQCPYPVASAIYVGLRVHHELDGRITPMRWSIDDLNALYSAFFWRNALCQRYDQGFLTQLGTDLKELKALLNERENYKSGSAWAKAADEALPRLISKPMPGEDYLIDLLTDGRPGGAIQKALLLPMIARAGRDLLDEKLDFSFGQTGVEAEIHHIYPKDWCKNNITGNLKSVLDVEKAEKDWVNSIANMMPLSGKSNLKWRAKIPGQVLEELSISFDQSRDILEKAFIDESAYRLLEKGPKGIPDFWYERARAMARYFLKKTSVVL